MKLRTNIDKMFMITPYVEVERGFRKESIHSFWKKVIFRSTPALWVLVSNEKVILKYNKKHEHRISIFI